MKRVRAIGAFSFVGFFERVRVGRFVRRDTRVWSPICLPLAIGVACVARQGGA